MNRHASWIRRPEDPRSAWRWIWSSGLRFKPEQRRRLIIVLAVLGGGSFAFGSWIAVLGLAAVALVASLFQPHSTQLAALTSLDDQSTFPVSLTLIRNRKATGRDVGWICFVDGWLVYEGLRTNFAITPNGPATVILNTLVVILPDGQMARFGLLKDPRRSRTNRLDAGDLRAVFDEWKLGTVPQGESVFPPAQTHPAATAQRLKERLYWSVFLLLAAAMCNAFGVTLMVNIFVTAAAVTFIAFILSFLRFRKDLKSSFGSVDHRNALFPPPTRQIPPAFAEIEGQS